MRDMDETIATIRWTVQDVFDAFKQEFKREPSEEELDSILNKLDTDKIEENGIEKGWDVINELIDDKAHDIINELKNGNLKQELQTASGPIISFAPFGYEGSLVTVETDLRRGIPAVDIVGLSDAAVGETRERVRNAIKQSGFDFPPERVLMSLSPADLRKDGSGFDLPMALDIIKTYNSDPAFVKNPKSSSSEPILVLGELALNGEVRPVKGLHAAVQTAKAAGITKVICPRLNESEFNSLSGVKVAFVDNLKEAVNALYEPERFVSVENNQNVSSNIVQFSEENFHGSVSDLKGIYTAAHAVEIAVAGKHNLMLTGTPGCGKTIAIQELAPYLTPDLTPEENMSHQRIWSLAGLGGGSASRTKTPPFRMPHQTASIEGICGGGPNCRPGEISLAHNGILFLDEAPEFRTSVLQMLRVPLETNSVTLSRAGRSTVYPAKFQLMMAANPCPCGNYGCNSKICLDSAKSLDMYWAKVSAPLMDRIAINCYVERDENDTRVFDPDKARERIKKAYEIQRARGVYNNDLNEEQLRDLISFDEKDRDSFSKITQSFEMNNSKRNYLNMLRVSVTLANMDGREKVLLKDIKEALSFCWNIRDTIERKPAQQFYQKSLEQKQEQGREGL